MTHCNSRKDISLVILAAGLGRRFGGEKQLATVGKSGKPLMYYSVMDAWEVGIRKMVLIVNSIIEPVIRRSFLPMLPGDLEVSLLCQETDDLPAGCPTVPRQKPWGTGHALWCARGAVDAACIVMNADDYYGADTIGCLAKHLERSEDWAMVSYALENTLSGFGAVNRGLCQVEDGFLLGVKECLEIKQDHDGIHGVLDGRPVTLEPDKPVSMNIWAFDRRVFGRLEKGLGRFIRDTRIDNGAEYYLPMQVMSDIESGEAHVRVFPSREAWYGITYREDLARIGDIFDARD